jgi:DNA-binding HxlR family transcriptional regulator
MTADDLIVREPLTPVRLGVRYRVTRHGRSLQPVFAGLWRWGRVHLARPGAVDGTVAFSPARLPPA